MLNKYLLIRRLPDERKIKEGEGVSESKKAVYEGGRLKQTSKTGESLQVQRVTGAEGVRLRQVLDAVEKAQCTPELRAG